MVNFLSQPNFRGLQTFFKRWSGPTLLTSWAVSMGLPASATIVAPINTELVPQSVFERIEQRISQTYDIPVERLRITAGRPNTWSDSCLGLGQAGEVCAPGLTPGWIVTINDGYQRWVYHSDQAGQIMREQSAVLNRGELSDLLQERVVQQAAAETELSAADFKVEAYAAMNWGRCLGFSLDLDGENCDRTTPIPGWYIIVSGPDQVRTYHTNADGSEIRFNHIEFEYRYAYDNTYTVQVIYRRVSHTMQAELGRQGSGLIMMDAQPQIWNECLGLPPVGQETCRDIAVPGWRVVIQLADQTRIYHTNRDASEIRFNSLE
jgi:hypothetical protein